MSDIKIKYKLCIVLNLDAEGDVVFRKLTQIDGITEADPEYNSGFIYFILTADSEDFNNKLAGIMNISGVNRILYLELLEPKGGSDGAMTFSQ